MQLDGWTWEEMAVKADAGLSVVWPSVAPGQRPWMTRSDTEQTDEIRRSLSGIDDAFKTAAAYVAAAARDPTCPSTCAGRRCAA